MNRLYTACAAVFIFLLMSTQAGASLENVSAKLSLDQAVKAAISNNRLIKEAVQKAKAAVEEKQMARADLLPKVSATYRYTSMRERPFMYFQKAVVVPPGLTVGSERIQSPTGQRDNYHWNARIIQPIFTGFALSTMCKMAETGIKLTEVEKHQAVQDVTKQVKLAYFNVLLSKKYLSVIEETVKSLQAHVSDAGKFYGQGMIPYNDLLKAEVALADIVQKRVEASGQAEMAVSVLNNLLGIDLNKDTEIEDINGNRNIDFELEPLMSEAIKNRPELKALNLAMEKLDHATTLAKSSYYPQVSLIGQYEQDGFNAAATKNDFRNSYNTSVTLQTEWTFFEWGKTRASVAKRRYEKQALKEKTGWIEENIRLEVKNVFVELNVKKENIMTAEKSLDQAEENLRITILQYDQQVVSSTEVLDANTYLAQSKTNYYGALYGYYASQAELERAIGKNHINSFEE